MRRVFDVVVGFIFIIGVLHSQTGFSVATPLATVEIPITKEVSDAVTETSPPKISLDYDFRDPETWTHNLYHSGTYKLLGIKKSENELRDLKANVIMMLDVLKNGEKAASNSQKFASRIANHFDLLGLLQEFGSIVEDFEQYTKNQQAMLALKTILVNPKMAYLMYPFNHGVNLREIQEQKMKSLASMITGRLLNIGTIALSFLGGAVAMHQFQAPPETHRMVIEEASKILLFSGGAILTSIGSALTTIGMADFQESINSIRDGWWKKTGLIDQPRLNLYWFGIGEGLSIIAPIGAHLLHTLDVSALETGNFIHGLWLFYKHLTIGLPWFIPDVPYLEYPDYETLKNLFFVPGAVAAYSLFAGTSAQAVMNESFNETMVTLRKKFKEFGKEGLSIGNSDIEDTVNSFEFAEDPIVVETDPGGDAIVVETNDPLASTSEN